MRRTLLGVSLCSLVLYAGASYAGNHASEQSGDQRRGPPQVALDACTGASEGDTCNFTGRNNDDVSGTCEAPRGLELACVPENHQKHRRSQD